MSANWSRGFFRLWVALALLWVVPTGILFVRDVVETIQPKPIPAAVLSFRQALEACGEPKADEPPSIDYLSCLLDANVKASRHRTTETTEKRAAEEDEWLMGETKRNNPVAWVSRALALIVLPPLALLIIGIFIGWVGRGFSRTPS